MSLNIYDWFDEIERNNFYLTLNDIRNIYPGQSIEVLFFDRNFCEFIPEGENVNIHQNIHHFYRGKYTRLSEDSLRGTFEWYPISGDELGTDNNFEFHCKEHGTRMYWPFNEDRLNFLADHWRFYQGEEGDLGNMENLRNRVRIECKHFSEIDGRSLVGWRGPMMELNRVALLPNVNTL